MDNRLQDVLQNMEEAVAFKPNGNEQLAPRIVSADATTEEEDEKVRDKIIQDAVNLANDIVSMYKMAADKAIKEAKEAEAFAERFVKATTTMADAVKSNRMRNRSIGKGFSKVLEEHGLTFDGPIE